MPSPSKNETIEIKPQAGPQTEFFLTSADIAIYGGQAGGGKSWALIADPLRWIDRPNFRAAIFRRTYSQITGSGGLWDECQELYRSLGAKMRAGDTLDATFPSGAVIEFLHMQHEKTKYEYQGKQIAVIDFDEVTHFTEDQFFYMVSRNRSVCGVQPYIRASCNPDPKSWVASFIAWWINQDTGLPIQERSGVLRYFIRDEDDGFIWADSREELAEKFPTKNPLSVTFIPATLDDNPALLAKDPLYRAKLENMPRIERMRLLGGNWKVAEGTQIDQAWIHRYSINQDFFEFTFQGKFYRMPTAATRRIATIDTAGTSKEIAATKKGKEPSWSVCQVWDIVPMWTTADGNQRIVLSELRFLRYVWRKQVGWDRLKIEINETLETWNVSKAYIENAHFGQPLSKEIRGCPVELVGPVLPGMGDHGEGAKLERAIASGMLSAFEHGKIFLPMEQSEWLANYLREIGVWTGAPDEVADQIDTTSYACFVSRRQGASWGGVINSPSVGRR